MSLVLRDAVEHFNREMRRGVPASVVSEFGIRQAKELIYLGLSTRETR